MSYIDFAGLRETPIGQTVLENRGGQVTPRAWDLYPSVFKLKGRPPESWDGKMILDVGSGYKWDDPSVVFPGATVCAIDPEFGKDGQISWNTAHECKPGTAQAIPYDDSTFDLVLSSHAVPEHINPDQLALAISEMVRVLKPSGEIRLTPCDEILLPPGFGVTFDERGTEGIIALIKAKTTDET